MRHDDNEQILTKIQETIVRTGTLKDLEQLVYLNKSYYKQNLENINNGFLSFSYNKVFFKNIIKNQDLIVFVTKNKLLGYVLVNSVIETVHITEIRNEYFLKCPQNSSRKIAFSYQILIDKQLQSTGFFYDAQLEYLKYFKKKYEILVSTVKKENHRSISAHVKADWIFIDTTHDYFIIERKLFK